VTDTLNLGPDLREGNDLGDRAVLQHALNINPSGWALEFGTGGGTTARQIAAHMPLLTFDSFLGLPEDWRPDEGYGAGVFAQKDVPIIDGATVVIGLYDDTLPSFDWPDEVGLVHFDADLYSSTATCLEHMGHLLTPGVLVVFDEWFGYDGASAHEQRAWSEFCERYGVEYDVLGHGREQVAFQITKGAY
jgi:hypothetical protein